MNIILENFARQFIKINLRKLKPRHRLLFMRMYSHEDLNADIDLVVNRMDAMHLDYAMIQVQHTLVSMGK